MNDPLANTLSRPKNMGTENSINRLNKLSPSLLSRVGVPLFSIAAIYSIYLGWEIRGEEHLTAESGLGYALGIIGGSLMLLLLLYPARKKWRRMRNLGPTRWWFRIHMIFGVLGPILVLYHTNFSLGSLNSNTALFCMVLVAVSGLIGRYIYVQIHYGLYGAKATLERLKQDSVYIRNLLDFDVEINSRLKKVEESAITTTSKGIIKLLSLGVTTHFAETSTRRLLRKTIREQAKKEKWDRSKRVEKIRELLVHHGNFFSLAQKIVHLSLYERLFSLWHVLHFPLFLMMIISAFVHVFAVHFY